MTKSELQKKQGGRPLSYPPEYVYEIVERLLEAGMPTSRIDAALVKDELCTTYGVKGTIRMESLERLVEDATAELKRHQDRALLDALPETVSASIDHFMNGARDAFAIMVAEQNAKCLAAANRQCEELRSDKRSAQWHVVDLEARITELQKDKQALVEERDLRNAEAADLREKVKMLEDEVNRSRGASAMAQLLIDRLQGGASDEEIPETGTQVPGNGKRPNPAP